MRDTYVLIVFVLLIAAGTGLAWGGKVTPEAVLVPLTTGFLGLLANTKKLGSGDKS